MPAPKKNRAQVTAAQAAPSAAKDTPGWALKKADGEMFTRADIQYDLMSDIFNDRTFQFTSPLDSRAVSFKELYVETLSKFSKAAKSTVRQLDENPTWATNFCIASFLINIGRINTTVAFYPELRAYMRTYHPIPCLQKDEYCKTNLQDAPRIKTMLKSCQLPFEANNEAGSLPEISNRSAHGFRPPTTVVNLIFELFNVEPYVSAKYFQDGFVLHDLFSPTTIPTKLRAYAFLWLMHHFLEDPSSATDFEVETKIQAFQLARLEDIASSGMVNETTENVDLEEELKWGKEMQVYRLEFLKKWRGEEGIGFIDDLPNSGISALTEDANLTRKQKIMVQNYAHSIEADDPQSSVTAPSVQTTLPPSTKMDQLLLAATHEVPLVKPVTVIKTSMTHVERLQSAMDDMEKYGDDEDLDAPEDLLSPIQLAWRRNQNDIIHDRDVAYDSDDPTRWAVPDWKPKELKHRLVGFAFPPRKSAAEGEDKDKDQVVKFIGSKYPATTAHQLLIPNPNGPGGVTVDNIGGTSSIHESIVIQQTPQSAVGPPKLKRKRKTQPHAQVIASNAIQGWPTHPSLLMPTE